jgi:hypothetical protein
MFQPTIGMRPLFTSLPSTRPFRIDPASRCKLLRQNWAMVPLLVMGMSLSLSKTTIAQSNRPAPAAVPPEITRTVQQIDQAASQRNLSGVMQFYSRNMVHSDGLNYTTLENALKKFWERFTTVRYQTVVDSWSREGNALIVNTTTTVNGTQRIGGRPFNLVATVAGRQRYENGQIVRQEILSERSQLRAGSAPPSLDVQLPERVQPGRPYNFDAIVQEPLGDRLLLGTALEEPVNAQGYLTSPTLNLEILPAGGLFKVGQAPTQSDSRWLSAIIVREDGLTVETRRLPVSAKP